MRGEYVADHNLSRSTLRVTIGGDNVACLGRTGREHVRFARSPKKAENQRNHLANRGEAPSSLKLRRTEGRSRDGAYKRLGRPQTTAPHEER